MEPVKITYKNLYDPESDGGVDLKKFIKLMLSNGAMYTIDEFNAFTGNHVEYQVSYSFFDFRVYIIQPYDPNNLDLPKKWYITLTVPEIYTDSKCIAVLPIYKVAYDFFNDKNDPKHFSEGNWGSSTHGDLNDKVRLHFRTLSIHGNKTELFDVEEIK